MDDITLTPQEVEDIKDTARFRENTSLSLKILIKEFKEHCVTSEPFRKNVVRLQTHRTLQWWFIGGIIVAIMSLPLWLVR